MYVCLGVTCHLHFWQNDRGRLHATAVTWGWNGHNKRQHTKLTLEKKILPLLLLGFELANFQSRVVLKPTSYPGSHWNMMGKVLGKVVLGGVGGGSHKFLFVFCLFFTVIDFASHIALCTAFSCWFWLRSISRLWCPFKSPWWQFHEGQW